MNNMEQAPAVDKEGKSSPVAINLREVADRGAKVVVDKAHNNPDLRTEKEEVENIILGDSTAEGARVSWGEAGSIEVRLRQMT